MCLKCFFFLTITCIGLLYLILRISFGRGDKPTQGSHKQAWKVGKQLSEILSSNSEYLDLVQVPFKFAVKKLLEQLKAVATGEYTAPVISKGLGLIVYAVVILLVAEIHEFLQRVTEKDPKIEAFFKEKNLKNSLTKAHATLARKRSHGVTAVANNGWFLNERVPVDV
ncbi:unnamed protein product [Coffea canephora]|uniref:Uncharacterized protein n=1 Tax=Coffea canephora TaxID=49390 RepID=A0A068UV53_COFCA|nr:unnamed protein product [Coffea canephora]